MGIFANSGLGSMTGVGPALLKERRTSRASSRFVGLEKQVGYLRYVKHATGHLLRSWMETVEAARS